MASSSGYWMSESTLPDKFPNGLRVLLVDDDQTCLTILEKMLQSCLYQVTKCNRAEAALAILRERKNDFDIVMSDVHMPDMDGFKLLECVGLEMNLPVIMMSADDSKNVVMKGITHGACDYLIKPIRIEVIRTLWKHVFIKWKSEQKGKPRTTTEDVAKQEGRQTEEDADKSSSVNEDDWRNSKKRKDEEDSDEQGEKDEIPTSKKPRVVWSGELHQQFVDAVTQIGIDKAVPKKILELMNVPGINRENVASHLQSKVYSTTPWKIIKFLQRFATQITRSKCLLKVNCEDRERTEKFRLYLKKINEPTPQHQTGYRNPLVSPTGLYASSLPSLSMFDRQFHPSLTSHLQAQSLASSQTEAVLRRSRSSILPGYDPRTHSILLQNVVGGGAFSGSLNMQGSQMNSEYGTSLQQMSNIRNDYVPMPMPGSTLARNWVVDNPRAGGGGGALYSSPSQSQLPSALNFAVPHGITRMSSGVKLKMEGSREYNSSYATSTGVLMMHQDVSGGALDTGKIALEVQQPYSDEQANNNIPLLCDNTSMAITDQRLPEEFSQNILSSDLSHDEELNALWQGGAIGPGDDLFA